MTPHHALISRSTLALIAVLLAAGAAANAPVYTDAVVLTGERASAVEKRVGELLAARIERHSGVSARVGGFESGEASLQILLGVPDRHAAIADVFETHRIPPLTRLAPGAEGYLLRYFPEENTLLAAGVDDRGCLYAIGELLRQANWTGDGFSLPEDLNIRMAPAFEIRGTQYGQGLPANLPGVRAWTDADAQEVVLDYALAGANIFDTDPGPMYDFIKSYGLMAMENGNANRAMGDIPAAWEAAESIGRGGYVCLSVPEGRQYMLEQCEKQFANSPFFDLVKFKGGDGGGCECDRCDPYGRKFIELVEEMAATIHKHHPETRIFIVNQKFDNADDEAIFAYLREEPRDWLWAFGYGPGSDATTWQPGHRQNHRMDLFEYPGFGPYTTYPREIIRQIPPQHQLVYFNEITHWRYAQHAYIQMYPRADKDGNLPPWWSHEIYERRPDQFLTMVYDRRTFYAWPRYYHRVFSDLMHYGVGDITHSSGHHDHFNQWMWMRLLWAPRQTVEQVVESYARAYFGPEAAPYMAEALFQLEENLEEIPGKTIREKEGVQRYYDLVREAGRRMPAHWMRDNWLWCAYMEKAALDRYVQLAATQQLDLLKRIEALAFDRAEFDIQRALDALDALEETAEMKRLRDEAGTLGEAQNEIMGLRSEGYFNLDHDYVGLGWLRRQLERARDADGEARAELLRIITAYEDPGEGGHYDNFGTANHAPNAVFGYPYDHGQPYLPEMLDEGNRPSQRSMHFTQDEDQGVTIEYRDLDPDAEYRIRFTFVRPWYQDRYAMRMNQKSQTIYADDAVLAQDVELPLKMSDFFAWDIPKEATADGKLVIRFDRAADVARGDRVSREQWRNAGGWGTLVSEAWLMKKPAGK
ncbi:MAG: hypothetical protein KF886_11110 [Candidatus Hydrogenedentes bacterium]|nr:hypothetical protein [Candidatus Hydrogenedentota bacterium]